MMNPLRVMWSLKFGPSSFRLEQKLSLVAGSIVRVFHEDDEADARFIMKGLSREKKLRLISDSKKSANCKKTKTIDKSLNCQRNLCEAEPMTCS